MSAYDPKRTLARSRSVFLPVRSQRVELPLSRIFHRQRSPIKGGTRPTAPVREIIEVRRAFLLSSLTIGKPSGGSRLESRPVQIMDTPARSSRSSTAETVAWTHATFQLKKPKTSDLGQSTIRRMSDRPNNTISWEPRSTDCSARLGYGNIISFSTSGAGRCVRAACSFRISIPETTTESSQTDG